MFNAAVFAVNECEKKQGCNDAQHTPCLQRKILDYFNEDNKYDNPNKMGRSRLTLIFIAFNRIDSQFLPIVNFLEASQFAYAYT